MLRDLAGIVGGLADDLVLEDKGFPGRIDHRRLRQKETNLNGSVGLVIGDLCFAAGMTGWLWLPIERAIGQRAAHALVE